MSCTCQQHVEPVIVLSIAISTSAGRCGTACMCSSAGQINWAYMHTRAQGLPPVTKGSLQAQLPCFRAASPGILPLQADRFDRFTVVDA